MKDEVIEDIVNDVIKKLDDTPFGITDEKGEENESAIEQ